MSTPVHRPVHRDLPARLSQAHAGMYGLARHAGLYDGFAWRLARPLYRRVARDVAAARLPQGAVVVDVGTGPGRVPLLIARTGPGLEVEGIDLSAEMIARATRTATAEGVPAGRLRYAVADVAQLPHADGSVDLVVSSLSLHHWADVPAGLAEIRRVLRPGAQAWVYDARGTLRRAAGRARDAGLDVTLEPVERVLFGLIGRLRLRA